MDKLYLLFGILTTVFVLIVFGMNIHDYYNAMRKEGFADTLKPTPVMPPPMPSAVATKIKAFMDSFSLNATPEGNPTTEGATLCEIYADMRKAGIQRANAEGIEDNAAASAKAEATLKENIPGGALPCPLVQYPSNSATDEEWLAWFNAVPEDYGARIVFMVLYADETLPPSVEKIKDSLGIVQGFEDMKSVPEAAAPAPAAPAPAPAPAAPPDPDEIIQKLQRTAIKLLTPKIGAEILGDPSKLFADMQMRIKRSKEASDYLKKNEQAGIAALGNIMKDINNPKPRKESPPAPPATPAFINL
jgi:hypothetical protein